MRRGIKPPTVYLILALIAGVGATVRFWNLGRHSLWLDEAWLALSLSNTNAHDVIFRGPADVPNSTPWLLSMSIHWLVGGLGNNEWTLRLIPALFSSATIPLVFWLCRRMQGDVLSGALAATLLAFNAQSIFYAKELKQYAGDGFWIMALYCACESYLARRSRARLAFLIVNGLIGLAFSHAVLIVAPSVLLLILWQTANREVRVSNDHTIHNSHSEIRNPPTEPQIQAAVARRHWLALAAAWILGLGATYLLVLRTQSSPELVAFWSEFFPASASATAAWDHLVQQFPRIFAWFFGEQRFWVFALYALGLGALWNEDRSRAICYWIMPWLTIVGLATFRKYPMGAARIDFFFLPLIIVPAARGGARVWQWLIGVARWARLTASLPSSRDNGLTGPARAGQVSAIIGCAAWLAVPCIDRERHSPKAQQELRPLMAQYLRESAPQDATLLLDGRTHYAFRYYTMGAPRQATIYAGPQQPVPVLEFLRTHIRPGQRAWLPNAVGYGQNLEPVYEAIKKTWPDTTILREYGADLIIIRRPDTDQVGTTARDRPAGVQASGPAR